MKYLITILILIFLLGCQMDPSVGVDGVAGEDGETGIAGQDGQDGAPGEDGQDGAPGEDGQDLTLNWYNVYDNSGDYVGETGVHQMPYPMLSVYVVSSTGYVVLIGSWYNDYLASSSVYKDDLGKFYGQEILFNQEKFCGRVGSTWYIYTNNASILGSSINIVEYGQSSGWITISDDSAYDNYRLVEMVEVPFSTLGLPVYDPPFTLIAQ